MNKILIVLLSFVFVFIFVSVGVVYAQVDSNPCAQLGGCYIEGLKQCFSVGQVYNNQYCEYDGSLVIQKA